MENIKELNVAADRAEREAAIKAILKEIVKSNGEKETIAGLDILHKLIQK